MGRERDYGSEYERSNQAPRYKFHGGSSKIGKRPPQRYREPLIPVDENFYTPGEATAEADRVLAQPYTFDTDSQQQSSPQAFRDTSPKNKQLSQPATQQSPTKQNKESQQSRPTQGFWGRLFNRGNQNRDPQKSESPAVDNFQQRLRSRANNKLDENKQQVSQLSSAYNADNPNSKPLFNELRAVVTQDGELQAKQNELQRKISNYQSLAAERGMGVSIPAPENLSQLEVQLAQIKQVRATLLAQYPVSGLIEAHQVTDDVSDAQIEDILTHRFAGINRDIDVSKEKISHGDIPLNELDALIPQILAETPEGQKAEVEQYLKKQQRIDTAIKVGGTLGEIGLTAGAIVTSILSGGIVPTILGGLGTALGIGTAAYEFERADDLNLIAKTGDAGGNQLLTQPNIAKQDYLLGWANLVLAGIDGGLAIKEGAQVLDGLKAAEKLATKPGAKALYTVPRNKVLEIQRAVDLEQAGDPTAASTLFALRKELGGAKFDGVYDTLENGNLRVIDDVEAATIKGRGLSGLTPEQDAVADRLGNEFAQTIIDRGQQAKYQKDKIDYIRQKLDSGKLVEEIGESRVRDFYSDPKAEVWSNVHLQAKDAAGNNLGGQQAELDFFVHYADGSSPTEIVSAKLDGKKVKAPIDLKAFKKYYDVNIDGTQAELVQELSTKFSEPGKTKAYNNATNIVVKYTDVKTGMTGEISLSEFRNKIPEAKIPGTDKYSTKVRGLAPDDTTTKKNTDYIQLGIGQQALFNRIINIIDSQIK